MFPFFLYWNKNGWNKNGRSGIGGDEETTRNGKIIVCGETKIINWFSFYAVKMRILDNRIAARVNVNVNDNDNDSLLDAPVHWLFPLQIEYVSLSCNYILFHRVFSPS